MPEPSWGAAISAPSCAARKAIVRPALFAASITAFQAPVYWEDGSNAGGPAGRMPPPPGALGVGPTGAPGAAALGGSLRTLATVAISAAMGPDSPGSRARNVAICLSTGAGRWKPGPGSTVA